VVFPDEHLPSIATRHFPFSEALARSQNGDKSQQAQHHGQRNGITLGRCSKKQHEYLSFSVFYPDHDIENKMQSKAKGRFLYQILSSAHQNISV
jgi:hypothetical protein